MPEQPQRTIKRQLVDQLLEGSLDDYVRDARSAGDSWQRISMALTTKTGLYVTYESLRSWFPEYREMATGTAS